MILTENPSLVFLCFATECSAIPKWGEAKTLLKPNIDLENQHAHQPRKEIVPVPSPVGEGQTDTPINHYPLGEVLPSPPTTQAAFLPRLINITQNKTPG